MFENDYSLAWTVYLVGAVGGLLVWCRMTRWMWRWLKEILRLLVAVLLFTPTLVDPERSLHAPAIAITAMDLLFDMGNNAWRAVSDLVLYALIALGVYVVLASLRWFFTRHQHEQAADAVSFEAGYDESAATSPFYGNDSSDYRYNPRTDLRR